MFDFPFAIITYNLKKKKIQRGPTPASCSEATVLTTKPMYGMEILEKEDLIIDTELNWESVEVDEGWVMYCQGLVRMSFGHTGACPGLC